MPNAIQQLMNEIDSRVIRERALIFITALAVIFFIWNFLLQGHFDSKRKELDLEAQRINSEQNALEVHISELTVALVNDPAVVKGNEVTQLNLRIQEAETSVSNLSQGLIRASQLPKALEDVLERTTAINVLQVRTLPAIELGFTALPSTSSTTTSASESGGTGVYKHTVLIRVSGSYTQLLQLMTEIESLQWRFYWESLDYLVTDYPNAVIDISVFTLSSEEGLLGV